MKTISEHKWLITGLGILWFFWLIVILFPGDFDGRLAPISPRVFALVSLALTLLVLVILRINGKGILANRTLFISASVVLSFCVALNFFGTRFFAFPEWIYGFSSALSGLSEGLCFMLLFELLASLTLRETRTVLVGSVVLGSAFYLGTTLYAFSDYAFGFYETLLMLVLIPSYLCSLGQTGVRAQTKRNSEASSPIKLSLGRIASIMLVFGVLMGASIRGFEKGALIWMSAVISVAAICALVGFGYYLKRKSRVSNILFIGKLCVVAATIGLLLYFLSPVNSALSFAIAAIAYIIFFTVMFVFVSTVVRYQDRYPISAIYGITLIADSAGIAIGNLVYLLIFSVNENLMAIFLFITTSFFVIASVFFFNKHSLFPVDDRFAKMQLDDKEIYVRCIQLSLEHKLTPRQEEIFILLVRGKRVSTIAESLVLSPGTVRAHVHKVYEKMGVHSTNELMTLVTGSHQVSSSSL